MNNYNSTFVGIAGGSGSGKTTIANKIVSHFKDRILHIPHDHYYKAQDHLSMEERVKTNYDHPNALETDFMIQQLKELLEGKEVQMPEYDFTTHTRKAETITVKPAPIILVEGILIYENKELRDLLQLKIFIDVAADIRILRRLKRDVEERGRTIEMSINQYYATARPMHAEFVEPSKQFADVLIPNGGYNENGAQLIIDALEKRLE